MRRVLRRVTASGEMLCQNCLRVRPAKLNEDGSDLALCEHCKGQNCNCGGCLESIRLLRRGNLDAQTLGMQHDLAAWSAENGRIRANKEGDHDRT